MFCTYAMYVTLRYVRVITYLRPLSTALSLMDLGRLNLTSNYYVHWRSLPNENRKYGS